MLILWLIDPLGVATNSGTSSVALFYRVVAPQYPAPYNDPPRKYTSHFKDKIPSGYKTPFDDNTQIAVIVINDESIANITLAAPTDGKSSISVSGTPGETKGKSEGRGKQATWPPDFSIHGRIVEKIFESAVPKALFIDFGFFDDRDSDATRAFATTLEEFAVPRDKFDAFRVCRAAARQLGSPENEACLHWVGKAPIFLPRADKDAPLYLKVLPALAEAATGLVSTKYIGEDFETYNQYDLFDCPVDSQLKEPMVPSAALAMFSASDTVPGFRVTDCGVGKMPERLSIYWSDWGDTKNGRGSFSCRSLPTTLLGRIWRIFAVWFEVEPRALVVRVLSSFGGNVSVQDDNLAGSQFQDCPPHLSVSAHEFLTDETGMMTAVLHDRFVFYGGNFAMADDLIRPPTHNTIPGVYVHAMVLDNLLREEEKYAGSTILGIALTVLAIGISAYCSAWTLRRVSSGGNQEGSSEAAISAGAPAAAQLKPLPPAVGRNYLVGKNILIVVRGLLVCAIFVGGLASIAFFVFDLAPINFVGVLSFVGLHFIARGMVGIFDEMF